MSSETEVLEIRNASLKELQERLIDDLTCPINWTEENLGSASQIFLEKWHHVVSASMPNGDLDARPLKTNWDEYLHSPTIEAIEDTFYDVEEIRALAFNTSRFREQFRSEYDASCRKFQALKAQSEIERDKHYPKRVRSLDDVIAWSEKYSKSGILLPNINIDLQRIIFWEAISDSFERKRVEYLLASDNSTISEKIAFDASWYAHFEVDHVRFACNMLTSVGYSNGKESKWLIFDVSFHAKIMHCFPVEEPHVNLQIASIDNLQGITEDFVTSLTDSA